MDPAVVRRVRRAAGITPGRTRSRPLSPSAEALLADPDWLAAEYAERSDPEIAADLVCTRGRVYDALRSAGIQRRERSQYVPKAKGVQPWPAEVAEQVVERYASGESGPAIAEAAEGAQWRVCRLLRERWVLRSRSEARELQNARHLAAAEEERLKIEAPARRRDAEWPAGLAAEALERYAAGESGKAMATDLGLGQWRVYKLLLERTLSSDSGELRPASGAA